MSSQTKMSEPLISENSTSIFPPLSGNYCSENQETNSNSDFFHQNHTGIRSYVFCLFNFCCERIILIYIKRSNFLLTLTSLFQFIGLLSAVSISLFFIIIPSAEDFSQQLINMIYISCLCFKLDLYLYPLPL